MEFDKTRKRIENKYFKNTQKIIEEELEDLEKKKRKSICENNITEKFIKVVEE
jgi:hypothetical protein